MNGPSRTRRSAARTLVPAVGWTCLVLIGTSLPGSALPAAGPPGLDKLVHFGLYLVLAALWRAATRRDSPEAAERGKRRGGVGLGWLVVPVLAIFAGLDELHQAWIPGRSPSLSDWAVDLAGIAAGTWMEARRAARARAAREDDPRRRSRESG